MFDKFNFKEYINNGLKNIGFLEPTKIQSVVIKKALNNENIIGKSQTGTGKTHAFILPILQKLTNEKIVQAVIIVPTRELAFQINEEFQKIVKFSEEEIDIRMYVGGTNRENEINRLEKTQPQIVIGTIGKIKDLAVSENTLKIYTSKMVVIDEADMVFEMDDLDNVDSVFSCFEKEQILIFSATISKELTKFIDKYLTKTEVIDLVGKEISKSSIEHIFIPTKNKNKDELLLTLIKTLNPYMALIFANTKVKVDEITDFLSNNNIKVGKITGDLQSRERKQVLKRVKDGIYQYIVASDIASRGIDITGVSHVINYELPEDLDFYVHRMGRTARYDQTGIAISFYDFEDDQYINKLINKGLICKYMSLKNGELILTHERNIKQPKKTSVEEEAIHKKYPL